MGRRNLLVVIFMTFNVLERDTLTLPFAVRFNRLP